MLSVSSYLENFLSHVQVGDSSIKLAKIQSLLLSRYVENENNVRLDEINNVLNQRRSHCALHFQEINQLALSDNFLNSLYSFKNSSQIFKGVYKYLKLFLIFPTGKYGKIGEIVKKRQLLLRRRHQLALRKMFENLSVQEDSNSNCEVLPYLQHREIVWEKPLSSDCSKMLKTESEQEQEQTFSNVMLKTFPKYLEKKPRYSECSSKLMPKNETESFCRRASKKNITLQKSTLRGEQSAESSSLHHLKGKIPLPKEKSKIKTQCRFSSQHFKAESESSNRRKNLPLNDVFKTSQPKVIQRSSSPFFPKRTTKLSSISSNSAAQKSGRSVTKKQNIEEFFRGKTFRESKKPDQIISIAKLLSRNGTFSSFNPTKDVKTKKETRSKPLSLRNIPTSYLKKRAAVQTINNKPISTFNEVIHVGEKQPFKPFLGTTQSIKLRDTLKKHNHTKKEVTAEIKKILIDKRVEKIPRSQIYYKNFSPKIHKSFERFTDRITSYDFPTLLSHDFFRANTVHVKDF